MRIGVHLSEEGLIVYVRVPTSKRVVVALGVASVAAGVLALGDVSANAATAQSTIRYRDASGHITKVWHGSRSDAAALAAGWASGHPRTGHTVAIGKTTKIVKTARCRPPTTYWVFHGSRLTCFAYSGSMRINLGGVYEVDSGNNVGSYRTGGKSYHLDRYTSDFWATGKTVTYIQIN
jgi:hypothetical protein